MKPKFIKTPKDLQTKHKAICEGFIHQAIQKTEKAKIYVDEAKAFYRELNKVKSIDELISLHTYRDSLISACGISEKAKSKLTEAELDDAIERVLVMIANDNAEDFKEEVLFRYLLTKGDSLGGSMRNLTGQSAAIKLVEVITMKINNKNMDLRVMKNASGKTQRIWWANRVLLFDVTPKLIGKNIDVILLDMSCEEGSVESALANSECYIACGELKGGIDPAGADEHWKTAGSALDRIRVAFKRKPPALFFVGAAIEAAMAEEIFKQLENGRLSYAANLTVDEQLEDLVEWIVSL